MKRTCTFKTDELVGFREGFTKKIEGDFEIPDCLYPFQKQIKLTEKNEFQVQKYKGIKLF